MSLSPFERGDSRAAVSERISWRTQILSREFSRIDDPELAIELACRAERNNLAAARSGLPTIGQELENQFGLRFRVQSHVYLPTVNTAQRWRVGDMGLPEDLYPVIEPLNMSERFMDFIGKVDRCTTKVFLPVDTMPGFRKDAAPRHNSFCSSDPCGLLLFLDAATLHETIFAHEIGHAWVQYVDQCEDERTLADVSDPARSNQVNFIQSFVLDLRETRGSRNPWKNCNSSIKGIPCGPCQIVPGTDKDKLCKGLKWQSNMEDHMKCCARILCSCIKRGGGNLIKGCGTYIPPGGISKNRRGQFQVINEDTNSYEPHFKCCLKRLGWTNPTQEIM